MRLLTTTGLSSAIVLAFALAGCTAPSSYSSPQPRSSSSSDTRNHANYHADNFGEPDNTPFQGVYPGR
ncbi:hypothetical protein [Achromobacter kerstersii]|uniref:hypothetical protein n=1 Tax=Achromobacter kerstersii TaxID=1353890 RepID=UPI003D03A926